MLRFHGIFLSIKNMRENSIHQKSVDFTEFLRKNGDSEFTKFQHCAYPMIGTLALDMMILEVDLMPISLMALAGGPTKITPS